MNNKDTILGFLRVFISNPESLRKYCHEQVSLKWNQETVASGLDELIRLGYDQQKCFPNLFFQIEDLIETNEKVAVRLIQRGTLQSQWQGVSDVGGSYAVPEMMFFEMKHGLIFTIWPVLDIESKKQQIKSSASESDALSC